ncbi:hypothetical protein KIL84_022926 [Mauremys mutica]|uniref:Uncharacterized protein n=1 Tax=Mauremys mutica TaxID=74926 RepID=A0A9D3WP13_9SAUR|nr:hypothetical protein KIL84_022926 [Mauremys mutica]
MPCRPRGRTVSSPSLCLCMRPAWHDGASSRLRCLGATGMPVMGTEATSWSQQRSGQPGAQLQAVFGAGNLAPSPSPSPPETGSHGCSTVPTLPNRRRASLGAVSFSLPAQASLASAAGWGGNHHLPTGRAKAASLLSAALLPSHGTGGPEG